jgi:hypothetical protein
MVNNLEGTAVVCSRYYNSTGRDGLSKSTVSVVLPDPLKVNETGTFWIHLCIALHLQQFFGKINFRETAWIVIFGPNCHMGTNIQIIFRDASFVLQILKHRIFLSENGFLLTLEC